MKIQFIPTVVLGASMALIPAAMFAQTQPLMAQDQAAASAGAKGSSHFSMMDKKFLTEAAQGGMAEVKLGQLAADKGATDAVKDFGKKMVTDHTALNNAMMPFVEKAGITPPSGLSAKDQALYDRLNGLSGAAFDSAYASAMVKDHTKDKADFDKEAASTKNAELRDAVKQGDQTITEHLKMARQMSSTHGKSDTPGV